jgi:hypothetical protein
MGIGFATLHHTGSGKRFVITNVSVGQISVAGLFHFPLLLAAFADVAKALKAGHFFSTNR